MPKTALQPMPTTVVVAIHDAREAVRTCVRSLLRHATLAQRVVLIDDDSRDRNLWPMLERLADGEPRLELHRNRRNLGYTATINLGCELAGNDDVVLLNSDTIVTPRWLDKLRAVAVSRPRVATVTPLSNAAGVFSVPERGRVNRLPAGLSLDAMADLVERCAEPLYPEVPTGHGFCLLVRREALAEVGPFDAAAFPRGCGEENDFCMRARARGFRHLIDDATFIYHQGSASLRWRKRLLLWRAWRVLRRRHPSYEALISRWLSDDPLESLRDCLRAKLKAR